jgi:uncharacterized protein
MSPIIFYFILFCFYENSFFRTSKMITRDEALQLLKNEGCSEKVIQHCVIVSTEAVRLAEKNIAAGRNVDIALVEIGALLHDWGRSRSHGMDHAVIGANLAKKYNLDPAIVNIIKKHIGAGILPEDAELFGLPEDDYIPRTLEEKIVAHADNMVKGTKVITLKKRNKLLKRAGMDKEIRQRVKELAKEADPDCPEMDIDADADIDEIDDADNEE